MDKSGTDRPAVKSAGGGKKNPLMLIQAGPFFDLPVEDQLERLIEGLKKREVWEQDQEAVEVVIEMRLFCDDDFSYRRILRKQVYPGLPSATYSRAWSPRLRLVILKKILDGWRGVSVEKNWRWETDAEECFLYVCEVFDSLSGLPDPASQFQSDIKGLIRKHLEDYTDTRFGGPQILNRWILLPKVPDKIAEVLLHARLYAINGVPTVREELRALEALHRAGLEEASEEGVDRFLKQI